MKKRFIKPFLIIAPILFILFEFTACLRGSMPYASSVVHKEFVPERMDKIGEVYAFYPENSRERFVFKGWYGDFDGNKLDSLIGRKIQIDYVQTHSVYLDVFLKNYRVVKLQADDVVIFDNIIY